MSDNACEQKVTLKTLMGDMINENKRFAVFYTLFLFLIPLKDIVFPRIMGQMYQNVNTENKLERSLLILLVTVIIAQGYWVITDLMESYVFPIIQKHVIEDVTRYVFEYYMSHANNQETSFIIRSLTKLPSHLYSLIIQTKFAIIPCILSIGGILMYFFFKDLALFAMFTIVIALLIFVIKTSNQTCKNTNHACDERGTTLFRNINDTMKNLNTIAVYDTKQDEMNQISHIFQEFSDSCQKTRRCMFDVKTIIAPIFVVFTIISVWYVYAFRYKTRQWPASEIVALIVLDLSLLSTILQTTTSTEEFYYQYNIVQNTLRLFQHCSIPRENYEKPPQVTHGIHIQDMGFSRVVSDDKKPDEKKKQRIFDNLTVTIPSGQTTLLMGPVGSGKSTLLQIILGMFEPQQGRVFIDGQDSIVWHREHRRKMYYIPQTPILFDRTVRENILYGLDKDVADGISVQQMDKTIRAQRGGDRFIEKLPGGNKGLSTRVGSDGTGVSGGQRQLIWMMKLFFFDPEYIVMDEPTASLDPETKDLVFTLLRYIVEEKKKTVLIVTHDKSLETIADNVINIKDGKLVETHA